jgi:hypothetical protein
MRTFDCSTGSVRGGGGRGRRAMVEEEREVVGGRTL